MLRLLLAYNTKKSGQEEIHVKRRIQGIYISLAIMVTTLINAVAIHNLLEKRVQEQSQVESNLPTGDYLPDAECPLIRVVIKTNGFSQIAHSRIETSAQNGLNISYTDQDENVSVDCGPGTLLAITPDDPRFQSGKICIEPNSPSDRITINSLTRGYGAPSYRGKLELFATAEGIVIVNELPLEEYLYAVVPSEMPASYESEALKCQAVCARSYAHCQMLAFGYPEYSAHVDDSVSYQVYGNSQEQETTIRAVQETSGKRLWHQNQVVKTYYYSTSCGHSTSIEAWGSALTENNMYLQGVNICDKEGKAYEEGIPWYRWKAVVPERTMSNLIELNTGKEIGKLKNIQVTKRGVGGVVLQIVATGSKGEITVDTENKIRSALGGSGYEITKQDGTIVKSTKLLPSAFFTIAKSGESYIIEGGGFGHGIGMSQNGANEMAKAGKTYVEILQFFYPGTEVK